ncbi:acetyltransferase, GNAT family protein [Cryptosporidium muris RN66]|uniref:Acetyltransferase, GNAT family protein n=1 Tax=Cryptosporidium muris (strain RN66) TaxID=441375 RepID=B6AGF5_CRYMR|nr:acetyltransferase, GNAT family protein [Cryptosporidium muris RN66]EEA07296.1 acetyltransferase, GNAT family protein [Cryptosporidium muris RN66]|eukprot:XP_002141645.1 acetyltransferase, GNAT family protein [Cryptosporidium muris RN66]
MNDNSPYGGYDLNIREFKPADIDGVRSVCFKHFRSLTFPSVFFYITQHVPDIIALLLIGKVFLSFKQLLYSLVLYIIYLIGRSRWEVESYIRNCTDLRNVHEMYMISPGYHFWVAELVKRPLKKRRSFANEQNTTKSLNKEENDDKQTIKPESIIVGCLGLAPYRDDPKIARLLRLVVGVESRRMRIGTRLLAQMENFAKEYGYREIHLYTNNLSTSPIKFIGQHGYQLVQVISRGLMRGDLLLWRKSFERSDESSIIERNNIGERLVLD